MDKSEKKRRLRWKARCGMLELELLLTEFIDHHYDSLSPIEKGDFETLLCHDADVLYSWFMENKLPDDGRMSKMVAIIAHRIS